MLSDVYYRKRAGVPWISLLFFICCALVSIPTFFDPKLYFVFGGQYYDYGWQYLTHIFEHGSAMRELYGFVEGYDPILIHLLGNSLAILVTGILAERVLGVKRFLLLSATSLVIYYIVILLFNLHGNGASAVTYAYPPVAALIVLDSFKLNGKKMLRDWVFYLFIGCVSLGWVLVTIMYAVRGAVNGNLIHLASTLVGVFFAFIWRKRIFCRVNEIGTSGNPGRIAVSSLDKLVVRIGSFVPVFILCVLVLAEAGAIKIQAYSSITYDVYPRSGAVADINKNSNEIFIKFSAPVGDMNSVSYDISYLDEKGAIPYQCTRLDEKTFAFKFGREIYPGERIKITVDRVFDSYWRYLNQQIVLNYQ